MWRGFCLGSWLAAPNVSPICPELSVGARIAASELRPPTGHVFRVDRVRGPVWFAKYRLPDGRQVQKKLGPAWTERGRPPAGYFTKRLADDWLRQVLHEARRGTLAGMIQIGATFADAAAEWIRYVEQDRMRKPSTVATYRALLRSKVLPAFAELPVESVTPALIESWLRSMDGSPATRTKALRWSTGYSSAPARSGDCRLTPPRTSRSRLSPK
jgi:integrase